jgi:hypothetical protein
MNFVTLGGGERERERERERENRSMFLEKRFHRSRFQIPSPLHNIHFMIPNDI